MFDWNRPIPAINPVSGKSWTWKTLPICECGEPLVALGSFSSYPQIATSAIYAGERADSPYGNGQVKGSLMTAFVRASVAKMLAQANSLLPKGHMLLVYDGYRTLEAQQSLFDNHVERRVLNGEPREFVVEDGQRFVSIPSDDPTKPPPHFTGGAVDLTIIRFSPEDWEEMERLTAIVMQKETSANWRKIYEAETLRVEMIRTRSQRLAMGTPFDAVRKQTATRGYERTLLWPWQYEFRRNRRLLNWVMTRAGFSAYGEEYWHFDYGNQFDMARTGRQAIFGPAGLSAENFRHEEIRLGHYRGSRAIAAGSHPAATGKLGMSGYFPLVHSLVIQTGDLHNTTHSSAAII